MIFPPGQMAKRRRSSERRARGTRDCRADGELATFRERLPAREIDGGRVIRGVVRHRDADGCRFHDLALPRLFGSHFFELVVGGIRRAVKRWRG